MKAALVWSAACLVSWAGRGAAQVPSPSQLFSVAGIARDSSAARRVTPAEGVMDVALYTSYVRALTGASADSIDHLAAGRARAWIDRFSESDVTGLQLDPMGALLAAGHDDARASAAFDTRLSTPGLTLQDRAYTLLAAIHAFAGTKDTARFTRALSYMAHLDAMGDSAIPWRYDADNFIAATAHEMGRSADVITYGERALSLVPRLPYADRKTLYVEPYIFYRLVDVLGDMEDGRARIDSLGQFLLPYAMPPASLVAVDSGYIRLGRYWTARFTAALRLVAQLGAPAPPIIANYWFNTTPPLSPVPDAMAAAADSGLPRALTFTDGKVRLIEFGHKGCGDCVTALEMMQHLHATLSDRVEVWYVTRTDGAWAGDLVSTPVEIAGLEHYYVNERACSFPIAVWAGAKVRHEDGGRTPRGTPNMPAFRVSTTPTFVLIDGRGRIRDIAVGYTTLLETRMRRKIDGLLAESAQDSR